MMNWLGAWLELVNGRHGAVTSRGSPDLYLTYFILSPPQNHAGLAEREDLDLEVS